MKAIIAFVTMAALGALLIWSATRDLPPPLLAQGDSHERPQKTAPIVIVGVLRSDRFVVRRYPLQLRRLIVDVENVLKGDVAIGPLTVYYFTFASGFDGPQPLGMWSVGGRRVLWLRRDRGVLRTACDGWDGCTIGVYSGSHRGLKVELNRTLDDTVAEVLLTRGSGSIDERGFAAAVDRGNSPGSTEFLISKYNALARSERSVVKAAACVQLWINAQDRIPPDLKRRAAEAMNEADCGCVTRENGSPYCGTMAHADPPF
jgi:hypothetical protein